MKKKDICFAVNTFKQAEIAVLESKKHSFKPIFFIENNLVRGFGIEWIEAFKKLLIKSFPKQSFRFYADAKNDYGLVIQLISIKIDYIKIKTNDVVQKKIKQIAKKK